MSLFTRFANVFRSRRLDAELDEELQSHLDEAAELGRGRAEARRALGSPLHLREESRDLKLAAWLDGLRADAVFGSRQLLKHKIPSAAAVLSLALAIGACVSAFRLIDALLLRPLPVAAPERLRFLTYQYTDHTGKKDVGDSFEYPGFRRLRAAVKGDAELMAISYASRVDLTYGADAEMEKAHRQYVSGWTFDVFGLKPALGRLLTANDDVKPGGHPQAVLSYDYWQRRFARDPGVLGRSLRMGNDTYTIVGVLEPGFTGTETGTLVDIFVPTMMNAKAIENPGWGWFRTWVQLARSASLERVQQKLQASMRAFREERAKGFAGMSKQRLDSFVNAPLFLESAVSGVSGMQKNYRRSLVILAVLVALVLLIACANVANLMSAQAAARAREMALRVSIGAGRWRLVQLVLVESALVALLASALGGAFAWWAAPYVVSSINPPDNPARLILPADWRVTGFALLLALGVTFLFGLIPALRASSVRPAAAIKGGDDPHARRRLMNALVAAQVAFCFLVHFVAGLFVATSDRLSHQDTGFASERLLQLETVTAQPQPYAAWDQVLERLRSVRGVEAAGLSGWALLSGNRWTSGIYLDGVLRSELEPYFLSMSPGWLETMRIPLLSGRDFRSADSFPHVAIVNEKFAATFFGSRTPIGRSVEILHKGNKRVPMEIVGLARDARYANLREAIRPTAYVPVVSDEQFHDWGTFTVRTAAADPMPLASLLRREVSRTRGEFRVSTVRTQKELIESHTVRERLLAKLALFFAAVSLLLAAVGLFGVLDYSVQQRRREIGIRMALGAPGVDVARRVTAEIFAMVFVGGFAGLAAGLASERYVESLLFQVKATETAMLALPSLIIFGAALAAALPPVIRAVRIDPAAMLRAD